MSSFLPDEKKDDDDQSFYSSDCSSSSWHTSSSDASYSSDESIESSFSSPSSRRSRRKSRRNVGSKYESESFFRLTSLMRHRKSKAGEDMRDCEEGRRSVSKQENEDEYKYHEDKSAHSCSDESHSSKYRKRRRRGGSKRRRRSVESPFHWSTILLAVSLLIWCGVQIATTGYVQIESWNFINSQIDNGKPHHKAPNRRFEHDGGPRPHHPGKQKGSVSQKEMLKPGCELDRSWQTPDTNSKLLACQLLHELDLSEALSLPSSAQESNRRQRFLSPAAHLGSGLWRDVWKIRDNSIAQSNNNTKDTGNFVVLKTMKPEHEVIHRNLERHRREAATMSRLTRSPHVADLFAYCGNSILTEFAAQDLSRALKTKPRRSINDNHSERRRKAKEASRARRAKERNEPEEQLSINNSTGSAFDSSHRALSASAPLSSSFSTRLPLATRIDWALQASTAIADLHRSDVIHADITAKQFLLVSSDGGTLRNENDTFHDSVRIKVNDFNRCRFVPWRRNPPANMIPAEIENTANATRAQGSKTDRCTIRIPSAPGSYRSPEEYADKELTPQMDVYSLGNVLYEIWTNGETPWRNAGGKRVKDAVMHGVLPIELQKLRDWDLQNERILSMNGTDARSDDFLLTEFERDFGRVISKCYLVDPKRRITADDLVRELTRLLDRLVVQNPVLDEQQTPP